LATAGSRPGLAWTWPFCSFWPTLGRRPAQSRRRQSGPLRPSRPSATTPATAEQASRFGYEVSAAFGDRLNSLSAAVGVADALVAQGRFDEALAWTDKASEAVSSAELALSVWWRCVRAKALAGLGRGEHARELATGALRLAERTDDLWLQADSLADLAEVLRLTGRPREAGPIAQQALRLHERKGSTALADRVRVLLAKLSDSA
jgi:tetratricopeptide (TPR) repeat protein